MDSLSKVLISLREKKVDAPAVIILPASMVRKEAMPRTSFHYYMRMTKNIICL